MIRFLSVLFSQPRLLFSESRRLFPLICLLLFFQPLQLWQWFKRLCYSAVKLEQVKPSIPMRWPAINFTRWRGTFSTSLVDIHPLGRVSQSRTFSWLAYRHAIFMDRWGETLPRTVRPISIGLLDIHACFHDESDFTLTVTRRDHLFKQFSTGRESISISSVTVNLIYVSQGKKEGLASIRSRRLFQAFRAALFSPAVGFASNLWDPGWTWNVHCLSKKRNIW